MPNRSRYDLCSFECVVPCLRPSVAVRRHSLTMRANERRLRQRDGDVASATSASLQQRKPVE
jgi:hypothetical protein